MGERSPGSYLLLLELGEERIIQIGHLGAFRFPAGWYVYVGSALSGLRQRVNRHLLPSSVRRWHIDYLKAEAPIREVLLLPGQGRRECDLAASILSLPGASVPAPRFGASDCRCLAHLVHLADKPFLDAD